MRKIGFLSLLIAATLLGQNASAIILPVSSHYEGSTSFSVDTDAGLLSGFIDFAVYDTLTYPDEFIGNDGFTAPGSGQYIYAYQIFTDILNEEAIAYFAIFGLDKNPLDVDEESISSQKDTITVVNGTVVGSGVEPTGAYFKDGNRKGVWEFEDEQHQGILDAGQRSWMLLYSSNRDWVKGDYNIDIKVPKDDDLPVPPIPEPATLTLFGVGGVLMFIKRRRSV